MNASKDESVPQDDPAAVETLTSLGITVRRNKRGNVLIVDARENAGILTDEHCKLLASLPKLKELYAPHTEIGDDGLLALQGMENLQTLDLQNTKITDASWPMLQSLPALKLLLLANSNVTAEAAKAVRPQMIDVRIVI